MPQTTPQYTEPAITQRILLVDDDRTLRAVLAMQLEQMGYDVVEAINGYEALAILEAEQTAIDVILLDHEMPVMDGMEFITCIKREARFAKIPVIMATGSGQADQISQAIDAGVFYYLVKPVNYDVLSTLTSAAMHDARRNRKMATVRKKQQDGLTLLSEADFTIVTPDEADHLAMMLANCYEDPERTYPGLMALLLNAIEHGNLGIGFEEKSRLMAAGTFAAETVRRLFLPENSHKGVTLSYRRNPLQQVVTITDQGAGFDWHGFLTINPSRALQANGRGIMLAAMQSFDRLAYNAAGNSVTATTYRKPYAV